MRQKIAILISCLISLVLAGLFVACNSTPGKVPEPNYTPHLLKPGKYAPAEGHIVHPDTLPKPAYEKVGWEYVKVDKLPYTSLQSNLTTDIKTSYTLAKGRKVRIDSLPKPVYRPAKGKKVAARWSKWTPLSQVDRQFPFQHLGIEHGLVGGDVRDFLEDRDGNIWIATLDGGVGVWDGAGFSQLTKENGLSQNAAYCLLEDREGKIWIGTNGGGVNVYDGEFLTYYQKEDGLSSNTIRDLLQDQEGKIWVVAHNGISIWNGQGFTTWGKGERLKGKRPYCILEDQDEKIWIGTRDKGITVWDGENVTYYDEKNGLSHNSVFDLAEDNKGQIWIATYGGGINVWDGQGFIQYPSHPNVLSIEKTNNGHTWLGSAGAGVSHIWGTNMNSYGEEEGLGNRVIFGLLADSGNRIWMGPFENGIDVWDDGGFTHFTREQGLNSNIPYNILADRSGKTWIGHFGGGIDIWDGAGLSKLTLKEGLIHNHIRDLMEDKHGNIWIGTIQGLSVWDGEGLRNYHFKKDNRLNHFWETSLLEDRNGTIWMGTSAGLSKWDDEGYTHYTQREGLGSSSITSLMQDRAGRLWIGTARGITLLDKGTFIHYTTANGLSNNLIRNITEDKDGHIWIATKRGINIWDGRGFTQYTQLEGLASSDIYDIVQDSAGHFWLATSRGLNRLIPKMGENRFSIETFLIPDGLSHLKITDLTLDHQNQLWISTRKGVNRLDISMALPDATRPSLALRDFQPFYDFFDWRTVLDSTQAGVSIIAGENRYSLATVRYDSVKPYTNLPVNASFPYNINQFSLRWSGVHHAAQHQLRYTYLLEGKDRSWSPLVTENKITYRDLRPGRYTFKVRAIGGNGLWSDTAAYFFRIRPPWWLTIWAKTIYSLLAIGLLLSVYRYQINRKLALAETRRLRELDQIKTKLFTNITHEFRTPLTVIQGMANETIEKAGDMTRKRNLDNAQMIKRNSAQLLTLVKQMLELRKLEAGSLPVKMTKGDVIGYLRYLTESFHSHARRRDVSLHFLSEKKAFIMDYDPEKLLYIVSNLLSNAIKFTSAGGNVYFRVESSEPRNESLPQLSLTVQDTGVGIEAKKLPYIFDRFYQIDDTTTRRGEGVGIGLALTKELVKLLGGKISVKSELGEGTIFTVRLPITQIATEKNTKLADLEDSVQGFMPTTILPSEKAPDSNEKGDLPLALLVEDNPDVVRYLSACLEKDYRIATALDGQTGVEMAIEITPDIIISDVMMPQKDGYEVCEILKNDERTSHIPIILLTAKADQASRITGLRKGADAYLAKPFHRQELQIRLEQLIEIRRKMQERYAGLDPQELNDKAYLVEDQFLQKVRRIVEENLSDADFGLAQLCRAVGLSRSQLFRKLKALTGKSTSLVIRSIRLQRARKLLQTTELNVSEVAYEVGFKDLSYFSRCFQEEYGESPRVTRH